MTSDSHSLLAVRTSAAAPRRCFRTEPRLHRVYGTVVLPGGPAADVALGAPPGTARLLERLLHARNARVGRPLDRFGGKFGSSSSSEVTTVELTFSAADAPEAFTLVERWLTEPPHPDDVAEAAGLLRAETGRPAGLAGRALSEALRRLTGGGHVAAGDQGRLEESPERLSLRQFQLLELGWVTAAVGPGPVPWGDGATGARPLWQPAGLRPVERSSAPILVGDGSSRAVVCGARALPGLGLRLDPGELAAAVFDYGQELEPQRRLATLAGPTKPAVHSRRYGGLGFLAVVVPGPPGHEQPVIEAVEDLFRTLPETPPEHARRRLVHYLELLADTPRRRAAEEGLTSLYGAPPVLERLDRARVSSDAELRQALQLVADAPAACITVRR